MSHRAAAWLAWSIGIMCILLLALSLLFVALNDFATLMTPNIPEGGLSSRS
jgi:hypothetical protein